MNITLIKCHICALIAIGMVTGCAPTTPRMDQQFGEAVNTAKAQQVVNPEASRNTDPVTGLDGQAAKSVIDRYQKSYQAPPPPANVFTIGVGSSAGAGAGAR